MIDIKKVKEGDIFRFSVEKGYSKKQASVGMQVMEVYDKLVTVKCSKNGCMTIAPEHLDKVDDINDLESVQYWDGGFEDNRTK